jgi:hypothetical protein
MRPCSAQSRSERSLPGSQILAVQSLALYYSHWALSTPGKNTEFNNGKGKVFLMDVMRCMIEWTCSSVILNAPELGAGEWPVSRPQGWSFWDNPLTFKWLDPDYILRSSDGLDWRGWVPFLRAALDNPAVYTVHGSYHSLMDGFCIHTLMAPGVWPIFLSDYMATHSSSLNWLLSASWLKRTKATEVVIQHTINHAVPQTLRYESLNAYIIF